jgi:WD40 repeat protein
MRPRRFPTVFFIVGIYAAAWAHPLTAEDNILELDTSTEEPQYVNLRSHENRYVEVSWSGASGYYWEAVSSDSRTVSVSFAYTRRTKTEKFLRSPECEVFILSGGNPGKATLDFTLQRVRSTPVLRKTLIVSVTDGKE